MASILVRDLADDVKKQLATQAREHGRSMEAEVRDILTKATREQRPHIGLALLDAGRRSGGAEDLVIPERSEPA